MSGTERSLQQYTTELTSALDEMREEKELLYHQILSEEEEKEAIERELGDLSERLEKINEFLEKASLEQSDVAKTINHIESTKAKVVFGNLLGIGV